MSEITITFLLMTFAMFMFFTEKIPVWVTAMITLIVFVLTEILEPDIAFKGFVSSSVLLYMAMYIVGDALFLTGAANKIGNIVGKIAKTERQTIALIIILAGVCSGFLSNTGTAAIFIPIIIGVAKNSGYSRARLLMPLVAANAMGGNLTLLGSPPNVIASEQLVQSGHNGFAIFDFTPIALPILIVGLLYYIFIGYKFLPSKDDLRQTSEDNIYDQEVFFDEIPAWKTNLSVIVMILTVFCMVFEKRIGIPFYVSAWAGALALVVFNVISSKDALNAIDMNTVLLFVGTLAMGEALKETGAGSLLARSVLNIVGENPYAILAGILLVCIVTTNFMSNTATSSLMAPIGLSIALEIGADPRAVLMAVVIGCSCAYATPIAMPTNTMVYNAGGYKFSDYVRVGLPLIVINFTVSMILLPILFPFYP